ncbi:MAG: serine hydrolase [Bryobacteraceae bacterium]|nr:serine hydrolase [Bryobacteraceae bacterium]
MIVYGKQDSGDARSVAANTLFEIGSLTKVFTALLLADMAHRRELRFDDPVDRYLPAEFRTPERNWRAITLADLATHTSGLPLFPPITRNLFEAEAEGHDPLSDGRTDPATGCRTRSEASAGSSARCRHLRPGRSSALPRCRT